MGTSCLRNSIYILFFNTNPQKFNYLLEINQLLCKTYFRHFCSKLGIYILQLNKKKHILCLKNEKNKSGKKLLH